LTVTTSTFTGNRADQHRGTIFAYTGSVQVAADVFTGWCDHPHTTWNDAGYNVAGKCFVLRRDCAGHRRGRWLDGGAETRPAGTSRRAHPHHRGAARQPGDRDHPRPCYRHVDGSPLTLCPTTDQRGYASAPGPCDAGSVQSIGHR
jgi:hypothetical protein